MHILKKPALLLGIAFSLIGVTIIGYTLWHNGFQNTIIAEEQKEKAKQLSPVIEDNSENTNEVRSLLDGPFARMYVPSWGADYVRPIFQGTSLDILDKGIGHYTNTQPLDEDGNFAVAAHRTTVGANFSKIDELQQGQKIYIETNQTLYEYTHINTVIVSPTNINVLDKLPTGLNMNSPLLSNMDAIKILTMTSCHPKYSDEKRIVAFAVQTASYPINDIPESVSKELALIG